MGLFDKEAIQGFFSNPDMQDRLGGIGMALGGLDRGAVADLSGVRDGMRQRAETDRLRESLSDPALLEKFTPEQRQMLAALPPQAAQQLIADVLFAGPSDPVRGVEVGGNIINPIDGSVIYQGQAQQGHRVLSAEEVTAMGLPQGAYQQAPDGKITSVGGSGQNITINSGDASRQFGDAPTGTVFVYDDAGKHVMEAAPGGGERPRTVPLGGTEAETRVNEISENQTKGNAQAASMIATIDGLLADPGLDSAVGVMGAVTQYAGPLAPDAARARSRIEQIQGQAFLQAFASLKGGGQITEIEGQKAEAAIARLNTAQSADDFRAALSELKEIISRANGGDQPAPQSADLSDDDLLNLYLGGQ